MKQWEYGTLTASSTRGGAGSIELVTALSTEPVDSDGATMVRQMRALATVASDGWEPVGPANIVQTQDSTFHNYLLRRQRSPEQSQLRW